VNVEVSVEPARVAPTPGAPEKAAVRTMFDRIAPRYDLLNRLLSAGVDVRWRRCCIDELGLGGSARVLDLCTGTADLLLEWLSRNREVRGMGIDLSTGMLSRAALKVRRAGAAGRAILAAGDAERLPLQDATFDGAVVAFGIRNVGDIDAALREAARVLRPGGRLVILEFSVPPGLLGRLYRLYFTRVLPVLGGLVSGSREAYAYLPASVERFDSPEALCERLRRAGFAGVAKRALTGGIAHLVSGGKAA
jgi:demethylmenaquinone methyltransferase / 2-methoxy-6-polyprenyl-1,4-benzoquinol methylase